MKQTFRFQRGFLSRSVVFAATLGIGVACAVADCVPLPAGIVSWWAAEGNAIDQLGFNNGTLHGSTTFAPGEKGQAFSFNGSSGGVYIPDDPVLRFTSAMTIEAWVNPKAYGTGFPCEVVSKWFGNGNQMSYTTSIDTSGLAYFIVSSDGLTTTPGVDYTTLFSTHTVPLNRWSHFAATYDGTTLRIYLNGTLESQASWTQGIFPGTAPLVIGATAVASVFNGLIDEPAVYNRALSGTEIQGIFNAGGAGKCGLFPMILTQPQSQTAIVGDSVSFSATVNGTPPVAYQWEFDGTNIGGATSTTLSLTNVQVSQAGTYSLYVTNAYGATNSTNAILTVIVPPPCLTCPTGVVAWWPGAGDAIDQAGTNNGTLRGGVTFVSGEVGQAFSFDGSSGSVLVPDAPVLRMTNALTIEAWINPKAWGGTPREIVSKWFGNGNQLSYTTSIGTSGKSYVLLSSDGRTTTSNVDFVQVNSTNTVPTNQWTHFATTYDGSVLRMYLNGALENQATWTNGIFPGTAPLVIGEAYSQSFFNGLIDEPTVYNRALSANEIQAIYSAALSGKCGLPPSIFASPKSQVVLVGTNVTFSVTASGQRTLHYQWLYNGAGLPGATNSSLSLSNVQLSNAGSYSVMVTNGVSFASSSNALLKVNVVFAFGNGLPLTNTYNSFNGRVTVQLQNAYTNGLIFYTLDGSTPTFNSALYNGPFVVSRNVTLRALGYTADFQQSGELDPTAIVITPVYPLTIVSGGGGTLTVNPPGGSYVSNTIVSITAVPASGWTFLQWLGDASGTNRSASVTMNGNRSVQAVFGTTLNTTIAGSGSVALSPPGVLYPYGTVVALTALPQAGSYFGFWGNAAAGNVNPLYFTVTNANPTVSALFSSLGEGQFALTVTPNGHGRVTETPQANVYAAGAAVTLSATPDTGQSFLSWGGDANGDNNPLTITMDQTKAITANFSKRPTLTAIPPLDGLTDQGFRFTLSGDIGGTYEIDSSTGFEGWGSLMSVTNAYGKVELTDPAGTNAPHMFYRAMQLQ